MRRTLFLYGLLALSACSGGGRLAYGPGRTDYPQPGPWGDPWRPYIREAADRFDVPERWVRAVMRRESGGHEYRHGRAIVSRAGAMGLMQLMPQTYAEMQAQYGLGGDPFEPHDNIFAGTAYIRLLYARYGSPAFLAAYNAGPQRLDDFLGSGRRLPNETVDYVAAVAPDLGRITFDPSPAQDRVRLAADMRPARRTRRACIQDPDAAYDPASPCAPAPPQPQMRLVSAVMVAPRPTPAIYGAWSVQVGAYRSSAQAHFADTMARAAAGSPLAASRSLIEPTSRFGGAVLYRARLAGLAHADASAACDTLTQHGMACMIVAPGG